ncbi:MAG: hypothetical protein AB4290_21535 [Spirulina sp.]
MSRSWSDRSPRAKGDDSRSRFVVRQWGLHPYTVIIFGVFMGLIESKRR